MVIRPFKEGDQSLITELFAEVFQKPRTIKHWEWKFKKNPLGNNIYLAEQDQKVVSHCAGVPVKFQYQGEEIIAFQLVDFMTHKKYRGTLGLKGTFVQMTKKFFQDYCGPKKVSFVYGFPGERHRRLGELLFGYRPLSRIYQLSKKTEEQKKEAHPSSFSGNLLTVVEKKGKFDRGVDELWQRLKRQYPLSAVRDKAYFTWRYQANPTFQYETINLVKRVTGKIIALLVLKIDNGEGLMVDFLVDNNRPETAEKLISFSEQYLRDQGAKIIKTWLPAYSPLAGFLAGRMGYEGDFIDIHLECLPFDPEAKIEWLKSNFFYTMGDYDVY